MGIQKKVFSKIINTVLRRHSSTGVFPSKGQYLEISLSFNPEGIKKEVEFYLDQKLA